MTDVFETLDIFDPAAAPNRSRADFVYVTLRDAISDGRLVLMDEQGRKQRLAATRDTSSRSRGPTGATRA